MNQIDVIEASRVKQAAIHKEIWAAVRKLISSVLNMALMVTGVGFMVWSAFMASEYPGEHHHVQIIGILLFLLGSKL